jgi:DNA-binding transcriptional LysR family regulator
MKQNFTVRQGALDGVEAFLSVAQHRSFRRAAAELGVTPSAISQTVRALEGRVGAALFLRTTRSVGLTEAGERFLSRAKPAFEELVAASEVARKLGERPAGRLRLSVPRAVVPILLEPLIASFCQAYPEVEVEIAASEELVDLAAQGFDAGIRLGQFIAADMVAVRLTQPFPFVVVGSPNYLRSSESARNASTIYVSTPACACAARMGRLRPGLFSTATRPWRRSSPDLSSCTTTPLSLGQRSRVWDLRRCPARSPPRRSLTADCKRC